MFILEFCGFLLFSYTATGFLVSKKLFVREKWWDIGRFWVLNLEWRYASLGRIGYIYMEFSLFDSGKVTAK